MKQPALLFLSFILLASCRETKPNEIIIEGTIKDLPDGKIYLTEAHHWKVNLDSTESLNGHFIFRIKPDSSFVPYKASIFYTDSTKQGKPSIAFRNHMRGADSMHGTNAFFLEKGSTRIEGANSQKLRVFAGKETDLMYKHHAGFGSPGYDPNKRLARISYIKKEINKHPFSYFLLREIYNKKEQYSEKEWQEILSIFNKDVQHSKLADQIKIYLLNRTDSEIPHANLSLLNSNNQRVNIIDKGSKINMLVFWASWCGPCREEIPLLKDIQNSYDGKGLNLVNISIDQEKDHWEKALKAEKMLWEQCIADKDKIDLIKQQFNFAAIPLVIFTDNEGKEITRFIGYSPENKEKYIEVIEKGLSH